MASQERKGMIAIVIPSIIWGTVGINVRLLSDHGLEPFTINFFNMLIGSIFIYYFARYKGKHVKFKHKPNVMFHLILQGIFFGLTVILLFFAFIYTSISNASFLQQTMPLWVMVLSAIYLKEKITARKITALLIAILGVYLLFTVHISASSYRGDLLALISSFTFSGMILNARKLKNVSEYTTTFFQLSVACVMMLPFMLIRLGHDSPHNLIYVIALLLFLGIVNTGITQRLMLYGLRYVEASKASLINLIEPISATILAFIVLSQKITIQSVIGIVLILSAVIIIITSKSKKRRIAKA
jgi:drug/metabolite transporter (DMT)-like permease